MCKKKSGFLRENSDLFLFNKTKSFGLLKKFRSIFKKQKNSFNFVKDQICFVIIIKKWFLITEKSDLFFYV